MEAAATTIEKQNAERSIKAIEEASRFTELAFRSLNSPRVDSAKRGNDRSNRSPARRDDHLLVQLQETAVRRDPQRDPVDLAAVGQVRTWRLPSAVKNQTV